MKIVREFSRCGPCIRLGTLVKETAQFYIYDAGYEGVKRIRKELPGRYSPAHVEPCRSCRDHGETRYPDGYMD